METQAIKVSKITMSFNAKMPFFDHFSPGKIRNTILHLKHQRPFCIWMFMIHSDIHLINRVLMTGCYCLCDNHNFFKSIWLASNTTIINDILGSKINNNVLFQTYHYISNQLAFDKNFEVMFSKLNLLWLPLISGRR